MEGLLQRTNLSAQELCQVMQMMLSPDNVAIAQASTFLKQFIKSVGSLKALLEILDSNADAQFHQMAAILFKKSIINHFKDLADSDMLVLRSTVLGIYFKTTVEKVKAILADLISVITSHYFNKDQLWPEVLQEISARSATGRTVTEVKDALVLLKYLLDGNEERLAGSFGQLIEFLKTVLEHPDSSISTEALRCMVVITASLEETDTTKLHGHILQIILGRFDQLNKPGIEEEIYFLVIELLIDLAHHRSSLLDAGKSRQLLEYFIGLKGLQAPYLNKHIKDGILSMFHVISDTKRPFFTKNKDLLEGIFVQLVKFMLEAKNPGSFDDNEICLGFSSIKLLETLCTNLPKKMVKAPIMKILAELYASKEPKQLICMYLTMTAVVQGLQDVFKPELPRIMKEEMNLGLHHADLNVRNAAIKAISFFSEFLLPDILEYSSVVIPALVNSFDSPDIELVEHSLFVLDVYTEYLDEEKIVDFLPTLVPKVLGMITHQNANYKVRKYGIDAMISIMVSGGTHAYTYYEPIYQVIHTICSSTSEEVKLVLGTALACAGKLIYELCKKDKSIFTSKFLLFHQLAIAAIQNEPTNYDLANGCFEFLYLAVQGLGEEYAAESIKQVFIHSKKLVDTNKVVTGDKVQGDDLSDSDDEDEDSPQSYVLMNLDQAKASVFHWYYETARAAPFSFLQIEEEVIKMIEEQFGFENENASTHVRQQILAAIRGVLVAKIKRLHNGQLPPYRHNWSTPDLDLDVKQWFQDHFMLKTEYYISNEENKENVCMAIETIKDTLVDVGPAGLKGYEEKFIAMIESITSFDLVCFDKGDDDEEDFESDEKIYMATNELLITISDILKEDSFQFLKPSIKGLIDWVEKGQAAELDEFLGGYCDFVKNCPQIITVDTDIITSMIYESLPLNDPHPVRNGCYLIGLMHQTDPVTMQPYIEKSLKFYLEAHATYKEAEVKDNVVAGMIRMYAVDDKKLIPQDKVAFLSSSFSKPSSDHILSLETQPRTKSVLFWDKPCSEKVRDHPDHRPSYFRSSH